jgi:hypothetical protein
MTTSTSRPPRTLGQQLRYLARRAWWYEIHGYQSIYRFVFRRPKVPPGAVGFSYHGPVLLMLWVFIVVSAIELVVLDLIVRRWEPVRLPLFVLGLWGLLWMVGLLLGMLTRPHAVGPVGLRVRSGAEVDIPLSWDDVESMARRGVTGQGKQPGVTVDEDGRATLHLRMQNETNLDVTLKRPLELRMPHGPETVTRVTLYADDPGAFLQEVRRYL